MTHDNWHETVKRHYDYNIANTLFGVLFSNIRNRKMFMFITWGPDDREKVINLEAVWVDNATSYDINMTRNVL